MTNLPDTGRPDLTPPRSGRTGMPGLGTLPRANGHHPDMTWHHNGRHPTADTLPSRHTDTPTHPTRQVTPTLSPDTDTPPRQSRATRRVLIGVSVALGFVILAPLALSGQDLYRWADSPTGLNLDQPWPWFVPVALDLAAAACIGMTIVAVWRRERAGAFGLLVWVFALVSAYGQYRHGLAEKAAGRAQDLWWAMPAFAVLGPLLLEITLYKIRIWARKDAGEQHDAAAGFGRRWLPGVAFWETLQAWAASRREGIAKAADAIQFVRDRAAVRAMPPVEAVHYAFGATQSTDTHRARVWLTVRGVSVTKADLDEATGVAPTQPRQDPDTLSAPTPTPRRAAPTGDIPTVDRVSAPEATPTAPVGRRTDRRTVSPVDRHRKTAAVATLSAAQKNAADLRRRYPDGLPSDYQIRKATGWSPDRVKTARQAYEETTS